MATRATRGRPSLDDLAPETRAKVEAARARARTPEARTSEEANRNSFADQPSVRKLVEQGDLDPETVSAGNVRYALLRAVGALREAREVQGLSLSDVAQRSGIDRASLSRLENEHNTNPKLETLGRYAGALGLEVAIVLHDPNRSA